MRPLLLPLIAASLFISACASFSPPRYQPAEGLLSEGYSELELKNGNTQVSFAVPASSGPDAARDYAFLRAAELALRANMDGFEVVRDDAVRESFDVAGREAFAGTPLEGDAYRDRQGLPDTNLEDDPEFQKEAFTGQRRAALGHVLEIRMFADAPPEDADAENTYNAKAVSLEIFNRYGLSKAYPVE